MAATSSAPYALVAPPEERDAEVRSQEAGGAAQSHRRGSRCSVFVGLGVASVAAVAAGWAACRGRVANGGPQRADVMRTVEAHADIAQLASFLAKGVKAGAEVYEEGEKVREEWKHISHVVRHPPPDLEERIAELKDAHEQVNMTRMKALGARELLHPTAVDLHDGNTCPDDEEDHLGLCYKKCSLLTGGFYPIRTSAWSCCHEQPCSFFNSRMLHSWLPCKGYDVAGAHEGHGCPHLPGNCMANEEFSLGFCYKKCAILTRNEFPHRFTASGCCRYHDHWACLDPVNVKSDVSFNVGGGNGIGMAAVRTLDKPHYPMMELTEMARSSAWERK